MRILSTRCEKTSPIPSQSLEKGERRSLLGNVATLRAPSTQSEVRTRQLMGSWRTTKVAESHGLLCTMQGAETLVNDNYADFQVTISDHTSGNWRQIIRAHVMFDTSAINAGGRNQIQPPSPSMGPARQIKLVLQPASNIYSSTAASTNALVNADYSQVGNATAFSTDIPYSAWSTRGYNNFALNASGIRQHQQIRSFQICLERVRV